jgi:hypothetical protein
MRNSSLGVVRMKYPEEMSLESTNTLVEVENSSF